MEEEVLRNYSLDFRVNVQDTTSFDIAHLIESNSTLTFMLTGKLVPNGICSVYSEFRQNAITTTDFRGV